MPNLSQKELIGLLIMFSALLAVTLVIPNLNFNVEARLFTNPYSENFNVIAGKPFNVTCQGESTNNGTFSNMKWLNSQEEEIKDGIPAVQKIGDNALELSFSDPQTTHSGVYKCLAMFDRKKMEIQISVNFYSDSLPTFDSDYETVMVEEGSRLRVTCYATGELPLTYEWYDQGENVISSLRNSSMTVLTSSNGSTLIISEVKMNDSGLYTCTARNSHGLSSKLYEVIVMEASGNDTDNGTLSIRHLQVLNITTSSVRFGIVTSGSADTIEVGYRENRGSNGTINFKSGDAYEVKNLIPAGLYNFQFRAHSSDSTTAWTTVSVTLLPDKPEVIIQYLEGDRLKINWFRTIDDIMRETVDKYQLAYYRVDMQRGSYWKPSECVTTIELLSCGGVGYTIAGWSRRSYYELQLRAHTSAGYGEAYKQKFFLE